MAHPVPAQDGDGFNEKFFDAAEVVVLEIPVLKETHQEMLAVIEDEGWQQEDGLRTLLTMGLGYVRGELFLHGEDPDRLRLSERLMNLESVAAVMTFRTFGLMKDNQTLDIRMGALRNAVYGLKAVVRRLRAENEALKQEVAEYRASLPVSPVDREPHPAEPSRSWIHRFIQWLYRRV